ncbi:MAG: P-II family nitrogen regulator [Elusimicrobia bacterium]|nr:P-II family nitrogen regulator [Elusimicrobiota bacterium]
MKEIKAIIQTSRLDKVLLALHGIKGLPGRTVSHVHGYRKSDGGPAEDALESEERTKLEIVVKDSDAKKVVAAIVKSARTGGPGDGKIFVMNCEEVVAIRTGKRGSGAV